MKIWPLVAVTALYVVQAAILLRHRDYANAIVFTGYAIANCGFMAMMQGAP